MSTYPDSPPRPPAQIATGVAPPHSLEAEQSVLGGILLSDRAMYGLVIEEGLKPEDFYRDRHRAIYEAMLALYRESEPIDVLTVSEHLRSAGKLEEAGGKAAIDELTGGVPGPRRHPPLRADRARARAHAPPAEHDLRDPGLGPQPRSAARATSSSRPSARCSRSPTTTARRTSARSTRSSTTS